MSGSGRVRTHTNIHAQRRADLARTHDCIYANLHSECIVYAYARVKHTHTRTHTIKTAHTVESEKNDDNYCAIDCTRMHTHVYYIRRRRRRRAHYNYYRCVSVSVHVCVTSFSFSFRLLFICCEYFFFRRKNNKSPDSLSRVRPITQETG